MPPPTRAVASSSSSASRTNSAPEPAGPPTLWPENAKKSQPRRRMSSGTCPADCAPSTNVRMPRARAKAVMRSIGASVPSTLETWCTAIRRVRGVHTDSSASKSGQPSSRVGNVRTIARLRHGSRFE
jgi:hypothetical protein